MRTPCSVRRSRRWWPSRRPLCNRGVASGSRRLLVEPLEQRVLLDGQGLLAGLVFDDVNRDGVRDLGEPGLAGWTVQLQRAGATDVPAATFENPTADEWSQFGRFVAAVGDSVTGGNNVLVGSHYDDVAGPPDAGAAYLYDGASGQLLHTFVSPAPSDTDKFGRAVAALGENVLIGARYDETGANGVGAVHLFDGRTGNLLQSFPNPTLTSPTPFEGEEFGFCVAALGNDVLVGARWDNRWDDLGDNSGGAAYLFDGASGQLMQTFANPSPGAWDAFGISVAALGNRVIVGTQDGNAAYSFDAFTDSDTTQTAAAVTSPSWRTAG